MEHNQKSAGQSTKEQTTEEQPTRVVVVDPQDLPEELREQFASLFGIPLEDKPEPQLHNRRSTDKVAAEKPSIETQHEAAAKVLRSIADKRGLCFTQKEIEALTLLGDTFSPNFAAICAGIACLRYNELGWV
jgi:hypothetical protein